MFDEIGNLKFTTKDLRKFGLLVGGIVLGYGGLLLLRGKAGSAAAFSIGGALAGLGLIAPGLLSPLYRLWMGLALVLGWFSTRLILGVLFYLVFAPIGIVSRMLKKDLLDERIRPEAASYWHLRESEDKQRQDYERQF
ncbi:MAG: SxtJ family membrane protein [Nitrospiraceae bacterium]|nr:SxtJ family membrane protein [Nitrospiraceae bacterium]